MLKKSVVVFDIDGTLTDSVPQHQAAFEEAMRSFPFANLDTNWAGYRHHTDTGIFAEAWEREGKDGTPPYSELERRYKQAYNVAIRRQIVSEISGAQSFLRSISEHWIVVYATGSLSYGAGHKLSVVGVSDAEQIVVTASEFTTREQLVETAVQRGCKVGGISTPQQVISIGDGIWDLKTANQLGYDFLGIGTGEKAAQLRENGAIVYDDCAALSASEHGRQFSTLNPVKA